MNYATFFQALTGHAPFPYQNDLHTSDWPDLIDIPTGLGKTAAVGIAWLYRRMQNDENTPRRLIWCLPMRTLVEQTYESFTNWVEKAAPHFETSPSVNILMGGDQKLDWATEPERDAIIIGTQDMLISRALMRGYGMSRYAWPMHYAWLHDDALWVFDETQLMGPTIPTSAQLQAFRDALGTFRPTRSIWMSATLHDDNLNTVDHQPPPDGYNLHQLTSHDRQSDAVQEREQAAKPLSPTVTRLDRDATKKGTGLDKLASEIIAAHQTDTLTLVVLNRVQRAQLLFQELSDQFDGSCTLLHSRFRPADRARHMQALRQEGDRIIIATQVIEAGVDISARTLFTELAPWSSLVQRFGRANRYGEFDHADIHWIDFDVQKGEKDSVLLPYSLDELTTARELLQSLDDVGPATLKNVSYEAPQVIHPVLRRRDLLELFDTTQDLSGNDLDVSRYIRDGDDTDVSLYWRMLPDEKPSPDLPKPEASELCRVSISAAAKFAGSKAVSIWRHRPLDKTWEAVTKYDRPRPGETLLVSASSGGYDADLGFIGAERTPSPVPELSTPGTPLSGMNDDYRTKVGRWLSLDDHTDHVCAELHTLLRHFTLPDSLTTALEQAARWHDLGKSHPLFQEMLLFPQGRTDKEGKPTEPRADQNTLWAKSDHSEGRPTRTGFRHELASALAYLQHHPRRLDVDLSAYLIAAHHGKVRLSIRSLPSEKRPPDQRSFARGVWDGDTLPAAQLGPNFYIPETNLSLAPLSLGRDSWLERTLQLRDHPDLGPFRLALLESLLRLADHRASAKESRSTPALQSSTSLATEVL